MSNEKNPGCLVYIGDEILPSYIGILINHYKDPYEPTRIQWKVGPGFLGRGSININGVFDLGGWPSVVKGSLHSLPRKLRI